MAKPDAVNAVSVKGRFASQGSLAYLDSQDNTNLAEPRSHGAQQASELKQETNNGFNRVYSGDIVATTSERSQEDVVRKRGEDFIISMLCMLAVYRLLVSSPTASFRLHALILFILVMTSVWCSFWIFEDTCSTCKKEIVASVVVGKEPRRISSGIVTLGALILCAAYSGLLCRMEMFGAAHSSNPSLYWISSRFLTFVLVQAGFWSSLLLGFILLFNMYMVSASAQVPLAQQQGAQPSLFKDLIGRLGVLAKHSASGDPSMYYNAACMDRKNDFDFCVIALFPGRTGSQLFLLLGLVGEFFLLLLAWRFGSSTESLLWIQIAATALCLAWLTLFGMSMIMKRFERNFTINEAVLVSHGVSVALFSFTARLLISSIGWIVESFPFVRWRTEIDVARILSQWTARGFDDVWNFIQMTTFAVAFAAMYVVPIFPRTHGPSSPVIELPGRSQNADSLGWVFTLFLGPEFRPSHKDIFLLRMLIVSVCTYLSFFICQGEEPIRWLVTYITNPQIAAESYSQASQMGLGNLGSNAYHQPWNRMYYIMAWLVVLVVFVFCIRPNDLRISQTVARKMYHALIIIIMVPVSYLDVQFMQVSLAGAFLLMFFAEAFRLADIGNLKRLMSRIFDKLIDERDEGTLILTHMYLLVGCASPLWIDSVFELTSASPVSLAGVASVGVLDAMASILGSKSAIYRWPGSKKTVQGSFLGALVCILFLVFLDFVLCYTPSNIPFYARSKTGFLEYGTGSWVSHVVYFSLASFLTCLFEAFTCQIDNLVLPLVMYAALAMFPIY
mmetsp:Transcript_20/g.42  ORF Transcript_20/g.42 Transcript_20/m.42 type:complete len:787 (+) Transcript_20:83-2443(+)